jgi:hypothetical protein
MTVNAQLQVRDWLVAVRAKLSSSLQARSDPAVRSDWTPSADEKVRSCLAEHTGQDRPPGVLTLELGATLERFQFPGLIAIGRRSLD